jgi:predicted  nucleic acid-binding Zn-ribbon protein
MSSSEVQQLQAEVDYYRDRTALLRARLYRWGLGTNRRLLQLERELERAEQRLRDVRRRAGH